MNNARAIAALESLIEQTNNRAFGDLPEAERFAVLADTFDIFNGCETARRLAVDCWLTICCAGDEDRRLLLAFRAFRYAFWLGYETHKAVSQAELLESLVNK